MNHYFLVILDSCRFDSVATVWRQLRFLPKLGPLYEAYSFATWTHPAHLNFLTGRLPWRYDPSAELRSGGREYYSGLATWERRLGIALNALIGPDLDVLPVIQSIGYVPVAIVSAKPIGPNTLFARQFQHYHYVGREGATLERITDVVREYVLPIALRHKVFGILNVSETHYPYYDGTTGDQFLTRRHPSWFRQVSRGLEGTGAAERIRFSPEELVALKVRQQSAVQFVDQALGNLFSILPVPSFVTVTADHGDCLGEANQFLHGEVFDPAVLRVPFVEALLPHGTLLNR